MFEAPASRCGSGEGEPIARKGEGCVQEHVDVPYPKAFRPDRGRTRRCLCRQWRFVIRRRPQLRRPAERSLVERLRGSAIQLLVWARAGPASAGLRRTATAASLWVRSRASAEGTGLSGSASPAPALCRGAPALRLFRSSRLHLQGRRALRAGTHGLDRLPRSPCSRPGHRLREGASPQRTAVPVAGRSLHRRHHECDAIGAALSPVRGTLGMAAAAHVSSPERTHRAPHSQTRPGRVPAGNTEPVEGYTSADDDARPPGLA
jgi:hypothetical protein